MAVIGKIRNKMGILLVVFVGVALLAFVLGDLLSSAGYFMQGDKTTVGKMNGKSIKIDEFQRRLDQKEKFFSDINRGVALDDQARTEISNETWQEFIDRYVLSEAYANAGVTVGELELKDMMGGRFVHPFIQQQFTNPETGMFDANSLQNFLTYISEEPMGADDAQMADWKMRRAQWTNIETAIEKNRLQTKYQTLLEKGMYVTDKEVARQYAENGDRFNIRYVGKAYSEVPDSTVAINDQDLKKAYEENKNRFKSDFAVRGLRYALFDIVPTAKDSAALYAKIDALKPGFETGTDDTNYVFSNSDMPNNPRFLRKELLSKKLDSALYNAPNGFVYGPYVDGSSYFLAKKMAEKTSADSVKITAILIARRTQQGERAGAKEKADSILNVVKSGANLKALAVTLSEDPTTAKDSGSIGWIPYEIPGNPIIDTAYNSPVGVAKLVETPDAYAIVRAEAKTAPVRKILVAFVSTDIKPSEATVNAIYASASDFALEHKTIEDFDRAAKSGKYIIREDGFLRQNAQTVTGIPDSKNMVKWAFDNKKVGDVSGIEQYGNRYMIAIITKAWSAGVPKFEEVKKDLEPIAKRDKKADMFIEEMKTAAASGNIDQVGTGIKKPVIPATDLTFQSYGVPGVGYEPAIIGAAAGGAQGKLVGPIKGVSGVYVVVVDAISKGANPPAGQQQKADMARMAGQRVFSEALEALNAAAEVRDMRYKFY